VYQHRALTSLDIEPALKSAPAAGHDSRKGSTRVGVNPETWTHGSAAQRSQWFDTGFKSGDPAACDTFGS
jgi:predicted metalloprotease